MVVYRFYETHISGGLSRVQINEHQVVNFMKNNERFKNRITNEMTDQDIISLFVMEYRAKEDLNPPLRLLNPPALSPKKSDKASDSFLFVRSHGQNPKEAFENAKEYAEYNNEYEFVKDYTRYYVLVGLTPMKNLIKEDSDIDIVLSELTLVKTRPKTLYMMPLHDDEFLLFIPRKTYE